MFSAMASTFFGIFTRKRKRRVSVASSEATSIGSSGFDEPEMFFTSPSKKMRKQKKAISPIKILPAFTFNQFRDEDIAFKIFDHNDNNVDSNSVGKTSFNSWSVASSPENQTPELDDSFTMTVPEESGPRRSPNGYLLPDRLPAGLIVTDLCKGRWRIGKSIGLGGFGEIYSATSWNGDEHQKFHPAMENFVIKVVS
jgi:hypothetical protein